MTSPQVRPIQHELFVNNPAQNVDYSPPARQMLVEAARLAGSESFAPEHLFLAMLKFDPSLLLGKLKTKEINREAMVLQMRCLTVSSYDKDANVVSKVLKIANTLTNDTPMTANHLLCAMIVEPTNALAQHLTSNNVDIRKLLGRFPFFKAKALELEEEYRNDEKPQIPQLVFTPYSPLRHSLHIETRRPQGRSFSHTLQSSRNSTTLQSPPALRRNDAGWNSIAKKRVTAGPSPEARARLWLEELIPDQAKEYTKKRFIEVKSKLFPDMRYRIYGYSKNTVLLHNKQVIARLCIHPNENLPPTDRVIGEYYFIQGDERTYLDIANITTLNKLALRLIPLNREGGF